MPGAEIELIEVSKREARLQEILEPVRNRYDYILVDCPPSLGLLTLNGLVAGRDGVLIPVQCEYLALEGLGQLTQTINRVKNALYADLAIRGVILTMYDGRTNLAADVVHEVQRYFGQAGLQFSDPKVDPPRRSAVLRHADFGLCARIQRCEGLCCPGKGIIGLR